MYYKPIRFSVDQSVFVCHCTFFCLIHMRFVDHIFFEPFRVPIVLMCVCARTLTEWQLHAQRVARFGLACMEVNSNLPPELPIP